MIKSIAKYISDFFTDKKDYYRNVREAYQSIPKATWDLIIADLMGYAEFHKPCWDSKFTPFIEGKRAVVLRLLANIELTEQEFLSRLGEQDERRKPD